MGPSTLGEQTSRRRRVRHALPTTRWPTEDEAARSRWLQPLRLVDSVVAEQRTWVPAMVPWRATADGVVTPAVLDWYGRFADGRPGVLVVEATGIRDVPSGPLLRIGDDRFVPGLAQLVETVRRRSAGHARLFIQGIDFVAVRRGPTPEAYFGRHLAVTPGLRDRLARALGDARWLLADPDWFRKVALGLGHLVRRCEFTNNCEGHDQRHKPVTCKLWDRSDPVEPSVPRTSDGRRLIAPAWSPPERG